MCAFGGLLAKATQPQRSLDDVFEVKPLAPRPPRHKQGAAPTPVQSLAPADAAAGTCVGGRVLPEVLEEYMCQRGYIDANVSDLSTAHGSSSSDSPPEVCNQPTREESEWLQMSLSNDAMPMWLQKSLNSESSRVATRSNECERPRRSVSDDTVEWLQRSLSAEAIGTRLASHEGWERPRRSVSDDTAKTVGTRLASHEAPPALPPPRPSPPTRKPRRGRGLGSSLSSPCSLSSGSYSACSRSLPGTPVSHSSVSLRELSPPLTLASHSSVSLQEPIPSLTAVTTVPAVFTTPTVSEASSTELAAWRSARRDAVDSGSSAGTGGGVGFSCCLSREGIGQKPRSSRTHRLVFNLALEAAALWLLMVTRINMSPSVTPPPSCCPQPLIRM